MASESTCRQAAEGQNVPLVFLHLSDIHFTTSSDGHFDVDADLRHALENDVSRMTPDLPGPVAAIVVSGDIAFSGLREEYETAKNWLDRLCKLAQCDSQNVVVVPGNHDIHRPTTETGTHPLLRKELRRCDPGSIDATLAKYLPGNHGFFEPLAAFNEFAARYGCNVGPDEVYWERPFSLSDGSAFCVRGMTTTLVSDAWDHRESARLVLGTAQCQMREDKGVSNAVLAHHPPEWLRDEDSVRDFLNQRSVLQLYGHKHRQRVYRIDDSVVVSAGAVHPDRREQAWEPCFNVISVAVGRTETGRELTISVEPHIWRPASTRFESGRKVPHTIELPDWEVATGVETFPPGSVSVDDSHDPESAAKEVDEMPGNEDSYRRLVWGFHSPEIGFATKMRILSGLELVADEDGAVGTLEIFNRAFGRAAERGQLTELWNRVNDELDGALGENPFD